MGRGINMRMQKARLYTKSKRLEKERKSLEKEVVHPSGVEPETS